MYMSNGMIRIRGARQHNLKNIDLDIRTGELTVFTGPSGSGKSSLVFDTLYAEGQRRYVETFSAYARQFLDRMDKPAVDRIDGVPPAIAIDQSNPVRSSRSTVGTMTEINDHLKLLYARAGQLFDRVTGNRVRHDTVETIYEQLNNQTQGFDEQIRVAITFPVDLPASSTEEEIEQWLSVSGFTKVQSQREKKTSLGVVKILDVVADRFRWSAVDRARIVEAIEVALKRGSGRMNVHFTQTEKTEEIWPFSMGLHCPESDLSYSEPLASMFSFNSAVGACEVCRGFGRVIGVDYGLVIPNDKLTLRSGALKPLQTPAWQESQDDLMRHAETAGIPRDTPWYKLTPEQQYWVINGSPQWNGKWNQHWFGIKRFFEYLETKSYKMHIRVLLSKYRSYTTCPSCAGARLKTDSLLWRIGSKAAADAVLAPEKRFFPSGVSWSRPQLEALPGLCLHDLMILPLDKLRIFFKSIQSVGVLDNDSLQINGEPQALKLLFEEISTRLKYLCDVGIGYLSLDRQSRTLSGGEVQRINLTTALGTSLVNTLFVLDEPSIGLHPRDMHRIIAAMQRLRDAGNTLVVVEHDPAVMLAADRMIDMGPGPGAHGGQVVFDGSTHDLRKADTLTGQYLGGRKQVGIGFKRAVHEGTPRLILEGACEHNLKNINIDFPLQRLVCVTGVSGSGKSTLIQDILAPALLRHFGKATDTPGVHARLMGAQWLSDVVFVDQSPIGKTARSNPASYVGAWDALREILSQAPLAQQRGYTASKFSANSGDGRCATCGGSGFEHVKMQFLSDVYLRCQDCNGQRYRSEILEVKIERHKKFLSVADVLDLTVSEAVVLFGNDRDVVRALQPIVDVGLDYVKLGQPVPTLSGGEAQRLKLAGFLAQAAKQRASSGQASARRGTLFMFDEPTTGLHFDDIAKLMHAMRKLLDAGNSMIVIEHNLDVIRASDWLIDLGPEGGEAGGWVVAVGTPEEVREHPTSHTGLALREYDSTLGLGLAQDAQESAELGTSSRVGGVNTKNALDSHIQIINAREHNLKSLSVNIPRGKFSVITGVSGSGKSTLAFDILFNEGQRRYLESLNAYARSIVQPAGRPEVDAVYGIPPTVAIEQRLSRGGRKSTVGTTTEVWHFLRLLFVKLGTQHCIHDDAPVAPQTQDSIAAQLLTQFRGQHIGLLAPLVVNRKGVYTDLAEWARLKGFTHLRVDGEFLPTKSFPRIDRFKEHTIELPVLSLDIQADQEDVLRQGLAASLTHGKGVVYALSDLKSLRQAILDGQTTAKIGKLQGFSVHRACPICSTSYPELDPRLFSYNSKHGWCPDCVGTGVGLTKDQRKVFDDSVRDEDRNGREQTFSEPEVENLEDKVCPTCLGARLNSTARAVKFVGVGIAEIGKLSVKDIRAWIQKLQEKSSLSAREKGISRDLIPEIESRLAFLEQVGLGYLTLDRGAPTLSGGEAQRIRLAAQLGSNLQGVCYVLDEPTIGLHPRDNKILLDALQLLSDKGNTLVVVEHDEETIRHADHIIDIGPSAGKRGGQLVAQGSVKEIQNAEDSQTGHYLLNSISHPLHVPRVVVRHSEVIVPGGLNWITVEHAELHNLKDVTVHVPLSRLVAITGVSGSGKSTLARDVLLANVQMAVQKQSTKVGRDALIAGEVLDWIGCNVVSGFEVVDRVLEVDQTPIGKTPRSCPATYIGFWDVIRKLFADTLEAKARGYAANRFSFNTGDGRCPSCEGQGIRTIAMSFLPDVKVLCESCKGARFSPETLAVTWRGKNIGEVLQMEVDEAVEFFAAMPNICHPVQLLKDVGLGYLTLGQPSPTLSGGEAQRIKLVTELSKVRDDITKRGQKPPHTLYVLDEPTVGLHMADVEKLIHVLHRLVDGGHSVVVIEHDLDVIAEADWIIDLGPDGGDNGGKVVAATTPVDLIKLGTHTGQALERLLGRRSK